MLTRYRYAQYVLLLVSATTVVFAQSSDSRLPDAAKNQDWSLTQTLLKQHADVNGMQADRTTALVWAAHWGNEEVLKALLAAGADVKAANRYGTSALSEAADLANVPIMEMLLKAGADANTVSQNKESVLMSVSRAGSVEGAKLLLDHGADLEARDEKQEETALMFAVYDGRLPVVQFLISKGANVNAVAHTLDLPRRRPSGVANFGSRIAGGFAVLTFAARQGYVEITQALLDAGANPNTADRDGMTPAIVACLNGNFDVARLLVEHGSDPNDGSLWEAVEFRNFKGNSENGRILMDPSTSKTDALTLIQVMLAHGADPTQPYGKVRTRHSYASTGLTPPTRTSALDHALESPDADAIRLMLASAKERGIKFDPTAILTSGVRAYSATGPGKMIFRTATPQEAEDIVALAIKYGADVNQANAAGNPPLHLAAQQGADDIVKLLAANNANLDARNKAGLTALDFAAGKGGPLAAAGGRGRGQGQQQQQQQQQQAQEEEGGAKPLAGAHESTMALLHQLMSAAPANSAVQDRQQGPEK